MTNFNFGWAQPTNDDQPGFTESKKQTKNKQRLYVVTPLYTPTSFAVAVQQPLGGEWAQLA